MRKTTILIVLDGWGRGPENQSNAIYRANPKTISYIEHNFFSGSLQASGISVGLPWGEEGNSEVGHLTMGIGRIILQYYPRISLSIRNGDFFKNEVIKRLMEEALNSKNKINLIGLIGEGNIHSSMEHLLALIKFAKDIGVNFALHLFTDGRDSDPRSAYKILSKLPLEKIGSISGRYYAMDRDKNWSLTKSAYDAMTGNGNEIKIDDIKEHISETYERNFDDEYVTPVSLNSKNNAIQDGDSIFFFNFREDRMRQIFSAFTEDGFNKFPIKHYTNLKIGSITKIGNTSDIPVAFPPQKITDSLGMVLSRNDKIQLRIAETQKYAHVTFFFNGLREKPFKNEYRVLIPSLKITRLDEHPEMRAEEITDRVTEAIRGRGFDFILVNYANPDMIAHTGNLNATIKAINLIDAQLERILKTAFEYDSTIIITSDHGNADRLYDPQTGNMETKHNSNPVPVYIVGKDFYKPVSEEEIKFRQNTTIGMLSDIAPTILDIMKLPKPNDMDGQSLLNQSM